MAVLAFTGDIAGRAEEARQRWGGPLCVTRMTRTRAQLNRVNDDLATPERRADVVKAGIDLFGSGIDEPGNVVRADVLLADEAAQRWFDDRYGPGVVVLTGHLRPVPAAATPPTGSSAGPAATGTEPVPAPPPEPASTSPQESGSTSNRSQPGSKSPVTPSAIEDREWHSSQCGRGGEPLAYPENRCDRVVVRFYEHERDAVTELGPLGWVVQPDARAIYAVSTYGHIGFCPHGPAPCPVYADHINSLYDATTGDGLGGGTAGQPLE